MALDFKALVGASDATGGLGDSAAASAMGVDGIFPSLTLKQRLIGFASCFTLGMVLSFLSTLSLTNPVQFGVLYTFGALVANETGIGGEYHTMFLFGPMRQIKNMFLLKRITATLLYFGTLIGTLVVAFTIENVIAVLVMICIQFLALCWYTLSYIPYARDCIKNAVCKSCSG